MALFSEFFGGTPRVPPFKPVDITAEQQKAIQGNQAALPAAQSLASSVNTFNQAELEKMLSGVIPGYQNIKSKIAGNIESMVSGQLPQDVADAVQRNAASRALYGGYGGTGAFRNLVARDLGLTSLSLTDRGLDAATRWMSSAAIAPRFDLTSMFITPQQRTAFAIEERNAEFQRQYIADQWDFYGSPGQQWTRFEDSVVDIAGAVAGAAACWVAREVFGADNPQWLRFRHWLLNFAPAWFRSIYLKYGERFAAWIRNKPTLKRIIRAWMEGRIERLMYGTV